MSMHALQEIERNLDKVGEDLWGCSDLDEVFDGVLQKLSQLKAQLYVQRSLQKTAKLLQEQANDKPLPNQQATRVKRFIRFTFGMSTRGNERHTKLRKLECNALKFCGLAYTIKELLELPQAHFDFLVASVVDFVHHYKLSQYLYRDDIDKAVIGKFEAEDEDSMKEFLKSHVELRPTKRKCDEMLNVQQAESGEQYQPPKARWPTTGSLTGEVYKLTLEDAQAITVSDQVGGEIWLTHPYHIKSPPFVTIPISKKLSRQYATQRPQIM